MSRRNILKVITALPFTGFFYIKKLFACSEMSLNFVSGIPDGYRPSNNDSILEIVSNYLGRADWVYANDECYIKTPQVAENPAVVSLSIGMRGNSPGEFIFGELVVVAEKLVDLLVTRSHPAEIPNRNGQVPLNYEPKTTGAAAVFVRVAAYILGSHEVTELNMRLNLSGANKARILVLLVPYDKSKPVQVIRQKNPIVMWSCNKTIYVDGPLPAGSENGYYYF